MQKFYVFHDDDYYECGGVGLKECDTETDALEFIESLLRPHHPSNRLLSNYILIKGEILPLKAIESVTKVVVSR